LHVLGGVPLSAADTLCCRLRAVLHLEKLLAVFRARRRVPRNAAFQGHPRLPFGPEPTMQVSLTGGAAAPEAALAA